MRQGASSATEWGKFDVKSLCNPNGKGRSAMPTKRLVTTILTAAFLATAAFAADSQPPVAPPAQPACPAWGGGMGGGPGGGPMGFLTQEQRLMHFADMQKATAPMSFNQARDYRRSERNKVMDMPADQRNRYAADLKARWEALPAAKKAEIQQQATAYWNDRPRGGRGHGWGRHGGGCW
jgi:Spy/CpxP family protein refolding chaperone